MNLPWELITPCAQLHGLEPSLVGAFVAVESGGVADRTRYEKNWGFYHHPTSVFAADLGITEQTEMVAQAHSYGLLQIMGATARDMGYTSFLHGLCRPVIGLEFGCRFIAKKKEQYPVLSDLVASYNAGTPRRGDDGRYRNQEYIDLVLKNYELFKGAGHG